MIHSKVQCLLRIAMRVLLSLLMRIEVIGTEHIPDKGPFIMVTNHLAALDTPVLLTVFPHEIRIFAASKHRKNIFYGTLLQLGGAIWVRRGEVDRQALKEALAWLRAGGVFGLAPEGTRSRVTRALQEGKPGAAYLATRAEVPIVPVGVAGTERVMENLSWLRKTDVRVEVGEPFRLPQGGRVRGDQLEAATELIMLRIAALLPEQYRGAYAEASRPLQA
ncbi:MAG: 1-acyl-sn-glycerol-3-phosphate acyltransferase [Anaerolineae bacterium]|nr:1-acyl-sn-glycerol-3-phosphate acyltransferase [Anaerolineae bacterium]